MSCSPCEKGLQKLQAEPMPEQEPVHQEPMAAEKPAGAPDIACGVTTAPREIPTLTQCLDSLCGLGVLPTVYAEPGSNLTGVAEWVPVVQRDRQLGVFRNWARMTEELLQRSAPYILTVQDDFQFCPAALEKAREFMADWPADCAMLSLWTPDRYRSDPGFSPVDQGRYPERKLIGAQAWLFRRETLIRVRNTQDVCGTPAAQAVQRMAEEYARAEGRKSKIVAGWCDNHKRVPQRLDIAVGRGLLECKLREYVHTPSLGQHFAETSTIGHPKWVASEVYGE